MSREEESNPSSSPGHAWIIKTRKIMPVLDISRNYLRSLWTVPLVGFCQHRNCNNIFSNLKTNHHVDVGSYNFVDRIGYAVVKMCEIEKSRLFKAEHFPSLNPEPILVRGGGILSEYASLYCLYSFIGLSPFYRSTFINLESYPEGNIDGNPGY